MKNFLLQRWFLIALVLVLIMGMSFSHALVPLADAKWLRDLIVASVMFFMALPLQASTMWRALKTPGPPLLAVVVSFAILPLVAYLVAKTLPGDFGEGLLVAAATPCTLASASVWTRRAGGNDSIATLVTLLTNAACAVATPGLLVLMMGQRAGMENPDLSFAKMTRELALLVLLPMVLAQILRRHSWVAEVATRRKGACSVLAQCGILFTVLLGAIRTGLKLRSESHGIEVVDLVAMLAAVLGIHVSMFWLGAKLANWCGFSRADQIAVGFSGSQKTLMVGLVTAMSLKVSILPMVAYHCLQLFVDTLIADRLRMKEGDLGELEKPMDGERKAGSRTGSG